MKIRYGKVISINNNCKMLKIVSSDKIYIGFQEKLSGQIINEEDIVSFIPKQLFLSGSLVSIAEYIKTEKSIVLKK